MIPETSTEPVKKIGIFRTICAILLSMASVFSFGVIYSKYTSVGFFSDNILGFKPESILLFSLTLTMLLRFFKKEVLTNIGRVIISSIMGLLIAAAALYSTLMVYGTSTIVHSDISLPARILTILGMAVFFIPAVSELVGAVDLLFDRQSSVSAEARTFFYEKNSTVYFFIVWALILLSFIPLFLYSYPINFVSDAGYQVNDYMSHNMSTHHPILHTLLLGFCYKIGYEKGDPMSGLVFYSIIQMLLLSSSFAFFLRYVKEKGASRSLRIVLFLMFLLNPLNSYYSISTVKGVFSAAFLIFALTLLLMIFDNRKPVLSGVFFVITSVFACHFRNNMLYAYIVAGIVALFLIKGIKRKGIALLLGAVIVFCTVGGNNLLMKVADAPDKDGKREMMSVPLVCLARVCQLHADELDRTIYDEILTYINKESIDAYTYVIADSVKNTADVYLLTNNTVNFFKLVAKVGLQYPGDYFDAIVGLTLGYYAPLNAPYFLTGSTKLYTMGIVNDYPLEEVKYGLPVLGKLFDYMYGPEDGRLRIPLFGLLWRCAPYFWSFVFSFFYLIYKKRPRNLCILLIPLLYMMSCLLGPVAFIRYIYINVAALPIVVYLMMTSDVGTQAPKSE